MFFRILSLTDLKSLATGPKTGSVAALPIIDLAGVTNREFMQRRLGRRQFAVLGAIPVS